MSKNYVLSDKILSEIEAKKKKIVITSIVDKYTISAHSAPKQVGQFIQVVNQKMEESGYSILSTDTVTIGDNEVFAFVTLVFEREE